MEVVQTGVATMDAKILASAMLFGAGVAMLAGFAARWAADVVRKYNGDFGEE